MILITAGNVTNRALCSAESEIFRLLYQTQQPEHPRRMDDTRQYTFARSAIIIIIIKHFIQ